MITRVIYYACNRFVKDNLFVSGGSRRLVAASALGYDGSPGAATVDAATRLSRSTHMTVVQAPAEWVEFVSELRLPPKSDRRLQDLMSRHSDGLLSEAERAELESLVELSERLSLARAQALHLLGRTPL